MYVFLFLVDRIEILDFYNYNFLKVLIVDINMFINKFDLDKFIYLNSILNNEELLLFFSLV